MQGRLINEDLSVVIQTVCAHCGQEMRIHADSGMQLSVQSGDAKPLVFMPDVSWDNFAERTIIDAY